MNNIMLTRYPTNFSQYYVKLEKNITIFPEENIFTNGNWDKANVVRSWNFNNQVKSNEFDETEFPGK